jgi:hypothetical protein
LHDKIAEANRLGKIPKGSRGHEARVFEERHHMDVSKVTAALKTAQDELNTVVDGEFKERRLKGLRPLTLAQNAIALAEKHLATATERTAPKADAAPAGGDKAAPAAGKKAAGK